MMFCCNSQRNHAYRQSNTSEDLWSLWEDEDSRGLRRRYRVRNYVPKFQVILHKSKQLEKAKKLVFSAPDGTQMCLAYRVGRQATNYTTLRVPDTWIQAPNAQTTTQMHLTHGFRRLVPVPCGPRRCFLTLWWRKPGILAQVQVETVPINSAFLIHNFSFRTKWFKRNASTRIFKRWVSLLTQGFSRVCFISFVTCL